MAPIRITGVVSCSSEDKVSCAKNLLVADSFKKWATDKPGVSNTSVILQLESEQHITGVDIGNNGSAFVEVLVANSANEDGPSEYHNLIITSAFMSPSESRSQTNRVKLRMYGKDDLCKPTLEKKWDRVKVVCTQPYNKTVPFGLSVLTIHGPTAPHDNTSLKVIDTEKPVSTDKTETTPRRTNTTQSQLKINAPVVSNESKAASQLLSKLQKDQSSSSTDAMKRLKESADKSWPLPSKSVVDITDKNDDQQSPVRSFKKPTSPKVTSISETTPRSKDKKDFSSLLEDVVFVMSGFQNPLRSDIREIGLSMGGQYRPDWTSDSTHLICSVPNTPKYNQVKGKGIIISKEWLFDCKKQKIRVPEKKYRLDLSQRDTSPDSSGDSEIEEVEDEQSNIVNSKRKHNAKVSYVEVESSGDESTSDLPSKRRKNNDKENDDFIPSQTISSDDEEGSEGIRAVSSLNQLELNSNDNDVAPLPDISDSESEAEEVSPMDAETDEETENDVIERLGLPPLPDFFSGHRFFLHSDSFDDIAEIKQLNRFLVAYGGKVFDNMCENVKFIITKADCWMPDFHQALSVNPAIKFLHCSWVEECSNDLSALDKDSYYIVNRNSARSAS